MTSGADLIAAKLDQAGCRHAFGIPGGEVLALMGALDAAGIAFHLVKHENAGGFMAEGVWHAEARAGRNAPGVLLATLGPGVANAVNRDETKFLSQTLRNDRGQLPINLVVIQRQIRKTVLDGEGQGQLLFAHKLLLHQHEIRSLLGKLKSKGLTLIPLKVYNKKYKIKLSFGLAKGKKKFDKREAIKKKEFRKDRKKALHQDY